MNIKSILSSVVLGMTMTLAQAKLVFVIRHGEKLNDQVTNLSPKGEARASCLVNVFGNNGTYATPQKIYAQSPTEKKQSTRPRDTVIPLAESLGLQVDLTFTSGKVKKLASDILNSNDEVVLVSWSNDKIPDFAEQFGIPNPPDWDGDVFDDIWIISDGMTNYLNPNTQTSTLNGGVGNSDNLGTGNANNNSNFGYTGYDNNNGYDNTAGNTINDGYNGYNDNGYDNTNNGYDNTNYGYDNTNTGYDNMNTGYDNTNYGYDNTNTGYDTNSGVVYDNTGYNTYDNTNNNGYYDNGNGNGDIYYNTNNNNNNNYNGNVINDSNFFKRNTFSMEIAKQNIEDCISKSLTASTVTTNTQSNVSSDATTIKKTSVFTMTLAVLIISLFVHMY